jgi:hypothetical protein
MSSISFGAGREVVVVLLLLDEGWLRMNKEREATLEISGLRVGWLVDGRTKQILANWQDR